MRRRPRLATLECRSQLVRTGVCSVCRTHRPYGAAPVFDGVCFGDGCLSACLLRGAGCWPAWHWRTYGIGRNALLVMTSPPLE